VQRRGV